MSDKIDYRQTMPFLRAEQRLVIGDPAEFVEAAQSALELTAENNLRFKLSWDEAETVFVVRRLLIDLTPVKERILEFIGRYGETNMARITHQFQQNGISTVRHLLGQLVDEGKLIQRRKKGGAGRPSIRYGLPETKGDAEADIERLFGREKP